MKKIKHISHLNAERQRLQMQRVELEHAMQMNVQGIKDNLNPIKIIEHSINGFMGKSAEKETESYLANVTKNPVVKKVVFIALTWLVEMLVDKVMHRKSNRS